jgi:uroporphyrinogen III methyltransferase/synthase
MIFMTERTYGLFRNEANKRLIANLKAGGGELLLFPEMICNPIDLAVAPDLTKTDWIIFPDLFSVDFFLAKIEDKFQLDDLQICALGEAVSDRLRFSQVHADVVTSRLTPESILAELSAYQSLEELNFLIPGQLDKNEALSDLLRANGATVNLLPVYQTDKISELIRFRTILAGGAIDEFIFSSPQDVYSFTDLIGSEKAELTASATDENTFQTLREFGFAPTIYK